MKRRHAIPLALILVLPVAAGGDRIHPESPSSTPAFSQGMVLTIDASGKFIPAPQTTDLRAALGEALSTSSEGLVVVKSPVPGGGVMVDLQGRFQNAMTIEMDGDGTFTAPCVSGAPADSKPEVK